MTHTSGNPDPARHPLPAPEGLDVAGFADWLRDTHPDLVPAKADAPITAHRLTGGLSNLTYAVEGAAMPLVVRRPPLGHVLASAHDMAREYRVMSALADTSVPVPQTIDLVDDTDAARVTGTPFLVMRRMPGAAIAHRDQNAAYSAAGLHRLGLRLADALAALHAVDPDGVGLGDFGHPAGYVARQLVTWRRQLDASRSRELPILARLEFALEESVPDDSGRHAVVHGDYRLDNVLVDGSAGDPQISDSHISDSHISDPQISDSHISDPQISAIVDWEMSTLGDPLVDLGILGLYWTVGDIPGASLAVPSAVDTSAGYPTFDELVDAYAAAARTPVPDLRWYRAFAAFKLAVIAEGIHFRYRSGKTVGPGFEHVGEMVEPLADHGLAVISMRRS
ncbi:phosphotransferase family protein [Rathayibacter sp. CAU 1779]